MSDESAGNEDAGSDSEVQVVEFQFGDESYAIDVSRVSRIVESRKITRLPRTPASVEGVMGSRGWESSVIGPEESLDVVEMPGEGGEEQILVLDRPDENQKVRLLVEDVSPGLVDAVGENGGLDTRWGRRGLAKGGIIRDGEGRKVDPMGRVDLDAVVRESGT